MKEALRRVICLLLVLCLGFAIPTQARAATSLPDSIYLTQEGNSTCTLCSAAMMIRARMYLNGSSRWSSVTESNVRSVAWVSGMGLRWGFTYELGGDSVTVSHTAVSGMSVETLKSILDAHPEGIVLYCGGLPHAVFATDYEGDTFYCAEPVSGYSGKRITLAESWLGHEYGSQATILNNVTAYWYVSSHSGSGSGTPAPECGCSAAYAGIYRCTASDSLNIRSGHGTDYSVVGSIPAGAEVTVTKASGTGSSDWAHVTYNGISGYVSMGYLEKQSTTLEITRQPESVTTALDSTVTMTVEAAGDGLTYQWQWSAGDSGNWSNTTVSGNTTAAISMEATAGRNGCRYRCVITDRYGNTVISDPAKLTVESPAETCGCSEDYAGVYVCNVNTVLRIRSGHGTGYDAIGEIPSGALVTVTKASGTGSSDWAHVDYNGISGYASMGYLEKQGTTLAITKQPEDVRVAEGEKAVVMVEAAGDGLTYQWEYRENADGAWQNAISEGNQTAALTVIGAKERNGYQYRCAVSDLNGTVLYTDAVTLTVAVLNGWVRVDGRWYYYRNGTMQTGWLKTGGYWYYLNADGAMQTGWAKVNGCWYYMNKSGVMQTGWVKVNGYWYYLADSGAMQTGWAKVNGKWYYLASGGAMQTGWLKVGGYWYYLDPSGAMVTGTQVINGKTYIFNSHGVWIG